MSDDLFLRWGAQPEFLWSMESGQRGRGRTYLPSIMKEWHKAYKAGDRLAFLSINGDRVDGVRLERLDLWLSGGGACQRITSLPWFELQGVLADIIG